VNPASGGLPFPRFFGQVCGKHCYSLQQFLKTRQDGSEKASRIRVLAGLREKDRAGAFRSHFRTRNCCIRLFFQISRMFVMPTRLSCRFAVSNIFWG
jgi:hypothetical protein